MIPAAVELERAGEIVPCGTVGEARRMWSDVRAQFGLGVDNGSALLTLPHVQPKVGLNVRPTVSLTLTSGSDGGMCVSDRACRAVCVVGESWRGRQSAVVAARAARSTFLTEAPGLFATLMCERLPWAHRAHGILDMRPNANSDVAWERVAPWLFATLQGWGGRAYDYSKRLDRVGWHVGGSYRVTYSATRATSVGVAARILDRGDTVAVVVPKSVGVPSQVWGYPTVDGDVTDDRYCDPAGHVVVLSAKGALRKLTTHPLMVRM